MLRTATLVLLFSLAYALSAQIMELRDYHGETIACSRSGLHGFADFCGADAGFYLYVFTGTVLSAVDASHSEQRLQIAPEEIFYGKPPSTLSAFTSQGRCLPEIRIGDRWLFYVRQSHRSGRLIIAYGDINGPVAETAKNIQLLRRLNQMHDAGLIRGHVEHSEWDDQEKVLQYSEVPSHKVTAKRASDNAEFGAVTDAQGNYEFQPLPSGTYMLSANTADANWAEEGKVTVKPGSCYSVGFTLQAAGAISGRVLSFADLAVPLRMEAVLESDQRVVSASVIADADGRYEIKGLTPGRYLVAAEVPDPANPEKEIRIYYPGVTSADRAVLIELGKTETRSNIDFELPRKLQY